MKMGGKVQLRQELREKRRRAELTKAWVDFRRLLAAGTRLTFILLLGATVLVFALCHEKAIQHSVAVKVTGVASRIANSSQPSRIRQNTLAYEKSVDEITQ
jgi:hypothetical protein